MNPLNLPSRDLPITPLTREEIKQDLRGRLSRIIKEFAEGFEFLENFPKSVTFFGSTQLTPETYYYKKAQNLAHRIVKDLGYSVVTGGGPGIMQAANQGAYQAGGDSVGLNIKLPKEQVTNPYVTKGVNFYYFFSRKVCLSFSAEAYVFFPGGFGTLDEAFEILTLIQTRKIKPVPVFLVGEEFWRPLQDFMKKHMLPKGMIRKEDLHLYLITDNEDKIIETIRQSPVEDMHFGEHSHRG